MKRKFAATSVLLCLSIASASAAQTVTAGSAALRPVTDFSTLPFMEGPKISPDGEQVASRLAVNGRQVFALNNLFGSDHKLRIVGLGDADLLSWQWVNKDWLVIRLGATRGVEDSDFYITRLMAISADGKTIRPIGKDDSGQSASVIWRAHDGSSRILASRQKSIFEGEEFWPVVESFDVATGKSKQIVYGREGVMDWQADLSGIVRAGVGFSDQTQTSSLIYRADANSNFRTIDKANGRNHEALTIPYFRGPDKPPVAIAPDEDRTALFELELPSMQLGKKIWSVDGYDVDDALIDPVSGDLLGVTYTGEASLTHWLSPELATVQELIDKAVGPTRLASIDSMTPDRSKMLVAVGGPRSPGAYYYYDAAQGGTMNLLSWASPSIKGTLLSPSSMFRYKARDGLAEEAILTLPSGRTAKSLPLILMPHGGPEARDSLSYDWWVQFLANRGYAVLQPNYRGSTGYGYKFLAAGRGEWGLKMQDDLNDAVDALAATGQVDAKRVCVVGASYGGYAALRAAQRDGGRYRCAASFAGVSDLPAMMRFDGQFLNSNASRASWRESATDLRLVSPLNFPEQFSTPLLIVHGKKDQRVPVAQSRKMAARLKAIGKTVDYIEQPEGDHHLSRAADRKQLLELLEAFLRKYNPA